MAADGEDPAGKKARLQEHEERPCHPLKAANEERMRAKKALKANEAVAGKTEKKRKKLISKTPGAKSLIPKTSIGHHATNGNHNDPLGDLATGDTLRGKRNHKVMNTQRGSQMNIHMA